MILLVHGCRFSNRRWTISHAEGYALTGGDAERGIILDSKDNNEIDNGSSGIGRTLSDDGS